MGEIPADDTRLIHAVLAGNGKHSVDGVSLGLGAYNGMFDIAEGGYVLHAQISI